MFTDKDRLEFAVATISFYNYLHFTCMKNTVFENIFYKTRNKLNNKGERLFLPDTKDIGGFAPRV